MHENIFQINEVKINGEIWLITNIKLIIAESLKWKLLWGLQRNNLKSGIRKDTVYWQQTGTRVVGLETDFCPGQQGHVPEGFLSGKGRKTSVLSGDGMLLGVAEVSGACVPCAWGKPPAAGCEANRQREAEMRVRRKRLWILDHSCPAHHLVRWAYTVPFSFRQVSFSIVFATKRTCLI